MARNRYPGTCYCCGNHVPVGFGHFERYHGGWRIKCVKCASGRTVRETDKEVQKVKKIREEEENKMSQDFYLLIAGSRNFMDYDTLREQCDLLLRNQMHRSIHIVEGEAKGADTLAKRYALERGFILHPFPADWGQGKSAGYRRNEQMHKFIAQFPNRGCVCFWDGQSRGTKHNFELCKKHKTPLRVWNYVTSSYV